MTRLFAVLCLVSVAAVAAPVTKTKAPTYYYPTREGDTQVYETRAGDSVSEYTMVVKKVEAADGRLKVTTERELTGGKGLGTTVEVSAAGVYRQPAGKAGGDPIPMLKLPAKVGDAWSPPVVGAAGAQAPVSITYTVAAVDEDVEVPAGKFKAIRVEGAANLNDQTMKTTSWYAPGVGMVKSASDFGGSNRVTVLKSFTPGK